MFIDVQVSVTMPGRNSASMCVEVRPEDHRT